MANHFLYLPRQIAVGLVKTYQRVLNPQGVLLRRLFLTETICRFSPSCSDYAHQALKRHGLGRGGLMTVGRVLRCHPWSKGGLDPVPEKNDV